MVLYPLNLLAAFQQKGRRCRKCRERMEIWGFLAMTCHFWGGPENFRCDTAEWGRLSRAVRHQELRTGTREAPGRDARARDRIYPGARFLLRVGGRSRCGTGTLTKPS